MNALYPYDPEVREHVSRLMYELLPALYRVRDEGGELREFLRVLAAPLAELRQNIEELHGDLFIDTCNDWVIPYLADMVGVELIFPDARSNRRDVRGAVSWRRRKGTRQALEEMASDLSGQMVVTHEGWKRLLLTQDLNLTRTERTVTDVRQPLLAEGATGPLDGAFHVVDARGISAKGGRYHPEHVVHWLHPTQLFPVREGTPLDRTRRAGDGSALDPDLRYVVHPLGLKQALRARRAHPGDTVPTDRIPPVHFAQAPGKWFDQEGTEASRFSIRLSGLPAAVAEPVRELRQPSRKPADVSLMTGSVGATLLELTPGPLTAGVAVTVYAVPLDGARLPVVSGGKVRGGLRVLAQGQGAPSSFTPDPAPVASPVAMLCLTPLSGQVAYFPGAVIEVVGGGVDALHESRVAGLAVEGYLRGALLVEVPKTWVHTQRWFYLAADGSLSDAQSAQALAGGLLPDVPLETGAEGLSLPEPMRAVGPGAAWPPLRRTAEGERMRRVPGAPARGPVFLHGGPVLRRNNGGVLESFNTDEPLGLVFAARTPSGTGAAYEPFFRLRWLGASPFWADTFDVLDANGAVITQEAARAARLADIARTREQHALDIELVVRFEASAPGMVLPPCEVSFTSDDGQTVLVHLPALETATVLSTDWKASPAPHHVRSPAVSVGADGSTHHVGSGSLARQALGAVAPLDTPTLRRRRIRYRNLCGWDREEPAADPPKQLPPTPAGVLDVDPEHGLFALAKAERPRLGPVLAGGSFRPVPVTVDYLDGFTDHTGARPSSREPLLGRRQPQPTRLVSASGRLHSGAPAEWHELPRYHRLADAMAAVAAAMATGSTPLEEVIQFEDSASYLGADGQQWPVPPPGRVVRLTVQAAEGQRPVLRLNGPWSLPDDAATAGAYESLTLRGLLVDPGIVHVPAAKAVSVQFCTLGDVTLRSPPGADVEAEVLRCVTGQLSLQGTGMVRVSDSVVDADGLALHMPQGTCELDRVTVLSRGLNGVGAAGFATQVRVLEASHVIFSHRVWVDDRFQGCVRYSRVEPGSVLPRKHRVVEVPARFVSRGRHDPAHARLAPDCAQEISKGAEDGSELGAFHGVRLAQRQDALRRRLVEFTPAGLGTGLVRLD